MVISVAVLELYIVIFVDVCAETFGHCEVHGSADYGKYLAGGHIGRVDGCEARSIDIEHVVGHGHGSVAREVEVRVVGEVDHGRLVGGRAVSDVELVAGKGCICHGGFHVAGKTVVAVGRVHCQYKCGVVGLLGGIHLILPAGGTTVECVAEVIDRQLDGVAVDGQTAVVDTVGITSDSRAKVCLVVFGQIGLDAVKAQHYVAHLAVASRHFESHDAAAIVGYGYLHACTALDAVEGCGFAVHFRYKFSRVDTCHYCR